jgi:hypothetical protein
MKIAENSDHNIDPLAEFDLTAHKLQAGKEPLGT